MLFFMLLETEKHVIDVKESIINSRTVTMTIGTYKHDFTSINTIINDIILEGTKCKCII